MTEQYIYQLCVPCLDKDENTLFIDINVDFGTEKNYLIYDANYFEYLNESISNCLPKGFEIDINRMIEPVIKHLEHAEVHIIADILPESLIDSEEDDEDDEEEEIDEENDEEDAEDEEKADDEETNENYKV